MKTVSPWSRTRLKWKRRDDVRGIKGNQKSVMIVAGEASGDIYGAGLARAIRQLDPNVRFFGMGGDRMRGEGVRLLYDPMSLSAMGVTEVVKTAWVMRHVLKRFVQVLDRRRPDVIVLIDYPDFNMRLAEHAKARNIPVIYYFSPSAWAWRKGRAAKVASHATAVCAVLPAERDVYEAAGAQVTYVGHPLIDLAKPSADRNGIREDWGLPTEAPVIALLPGSRRQEIRTLFPSMVQTAELVKAQRPDATFIVGLAHTADEAWFGEEIPYRIVRGKSYDVLQAADVALCAMGTVTLEAAIIGCPIVGAYRLSPLTYRVLRMLYKGRYVALPNIILNRENTPEFIQHEMTPESMSDAVIDLLDDDRAFEVRQGYSEVRRALGGEGAVGRTAQVVLDIALTGGDR